MLAWVSRAMYSKPQPPSIQAFARQHPLQRVLMADLTAKELRQILVGMGENPPDKWSKLELKHRLSEIAEVDVTKNLKNKGQNPSPAQVLIKELTQASRKKKVDLLAFCQGRLHMNNVDHMTMARLESAAMKKIMTTTPGDGRDLVGFGKHSAWTYEEVARQDVPYSKWIQQTFQEGGETCDPLLQRLALWLQTRDQEEMHPETPQDTLERLVQEVKQQAMATRTRTKSAGAPKASSSKMNVKDDASQEIGTLKQIVHNLQEEIQQMKSEPSRKKAYRTEEESEISGTDGSFQKVDSSMTKMP